MAAISDHMRLRPFQVATSPDPGMEFRKWRHVGTRYHISHRDAAMCEGAGEVVGERVAQGRLIFEFSAGPFVAVGL